MVSRIFGKSTRKFVIFVKVPAPQEEVVTTIFYALRFVLVPVVAGLLFSMCLSDMLTADVRGKAQVFWLFTCTSTVIIYFFLRRISNRYNALYNILKYTHNIRDSVISTIYRYYLGSFTGDFFSERQ